MPDKEIHAEIESLKSQLSELQKAREKSPPASTVKAHNRPVTDDAEDKGKIISEQQSQKAAENNAEQRIVESEDLISHFQELINALDEDLKQTRPATLLVIFALGVLVGRLLPR